MSGLAELAKTPPPPYVAVIFVSRRTRGDQGYAATAERMVELARGQPGFLGMDSARGEDGVGITVAYFTDEDAIAAWRRHPEHLAAQRAGRETWYADYEVRVARVERAYGMGVCARNG
ncbi:MAG: antibiotic biosynthesis monooxygenase family protein [Myxococcota bacterium]